MDILPHTEKTPGIAIFAAVLNFISAGIFFIVTLVALVGLIFGNVMGIYERVSQSISELSTHAPLTVGMNLLFMSILVFTVTFAAFYLTVGIGLLKGKKYAWFCQVVTSVLGLLGFPFWTVVNTVILIFFFQSSVRNHYKV